MKATVEGHIPVALLIDELQQKELSASCPSSCSRHASRRHEFGQWP